MHVLLAFDKFKGSLAADQVAQAVKEGIHLLSPETSLTIQSIADGGGGTIEILANHISQSFFTYVDNVRDPLNRSRRSRYLRQGNTAYIEMAEASGIELLSDLPLNALQANSYGTGQLILHAINHGCHDIYLMIGGSASTDLGTGALSALGFRFYTKEGIELKNLNGDTLKKIHSIDHFHLTFKPDQIKITILSDVTNPLLGHNGTSAIYGPQKGADAAAISNLEKGLQHAAHVIEKTYQVRLQDVPYGGAAGGIAAGFMGTLKASIVSGSDTIVEWLKIEDKIQQSDIVITGEGSFDIQSLQGKIVGSIISIAEKYKKKTIVVCGKHDHSPLPKSVESIYSVLNKSVNLADAIKNPIPKLKLIGTDIAAEYAKG